MSDNKTINEEDLKQVSGGYLISYWICPNCKCEVKPKDMQTKLTGEGDLMYYCPNCHEYYSRTDWDYRLKM